MNIEDISAWDYVEWLCKDRDVFCNDIKASTHFITAFVLLDIYFDVWLQCIYINALMHLSLYDGFVCCSKHLRINIHF